MSTKRPLLCGVRLQCADAVVLFVNGRCLSEALRKCFDLLLRMFLFQKKENRNPGLNPGLEPGPFVS